MQQIASIDSLNIFRGLSDKQIDQLIEYTNSDPGIKKFTSDLNRFSTKENFENWRKDKAIYTLSDKDGNLLGLIWFEWKQIPVEKSKGFDPKEYGITIAVRTYGEARGRGLFKPFLEQAIEDFKNTPEYKNTENEQSSSPNETKVSSSNKSFWVSIAKDNIPSQKAFENFGFKRIDSSNIKRVFMVI